MFAWPFRTPKHSIDRSFRYASYAAIATQRWAMAHSFLSRWLHPMETMFGAAEVLLRAQLRLAGRTWSVSASWHEKSPHESLGA